MLCNALFFQASTSLGKGGMRGVFRVGGADVTLPLVYRGDE